MKHVFIINPTAGKKDCTARMMDMAKALAVRHGLDVECILTKRPGHAMETARSLAERGEPLRIRTKELSGSGFPSKITVQLWRRPRRRKLTPRETI